MSIIVYQDVATPIVPVEGVAGRIREALGDSLRSMRYLTPDLAGLYQDAAGTTPVTAVGQPVGLMLDRRFGLARGPELVVNGDFASSSGWDPNDNSIAISGGALRFTDTPANKFASQVVSTTRGKVCRVTIVVSSVTAGAVNVQFDYQEGGSIRITSPGTYVFALYQRLVGTNIYILAAGATTTTAVVDSISIRELPGNHASQPTTTARPALRSGPVRIDYDGVDDYLRTTFPDLGSDVTIARSVPGVGAQILTGQTIAAGNWDDNVDSCAVLVIDRALTGPEQSMVTAFLNQQAGV